MFISRGYYPASDLPASPASSAADTPRRMKQVSIDASWCLFHCHQTSRPALELLFDPIFAGNGESGIHLQFSYWIDPHVKGWYSWVQQKWFRNFAYDPAISPHSDSSSRSFLNQLNTGKVMPTPAHGNSDIISHSGENERTCGSLFTPCTAFFDGMKTELFSPAISWVTYGTRHSRGTPCSHQWCLRLLICRPVAQFVMTTTVIDLIVDFVQSFWYFANFSNIF